MKSALLERPGVIRIIDTPSPPLNPTEVRLRVERVGICGSDIHIYDGANAVVKTPIVMGHELSGTVIDVGAKANITPGQRVTVMPIVACGQCAMCEKGETHHCTTLKVYGAHMPGAYAEEMVVAGDRIRPLPATMSFDQGALVEPLAVAVRAVRNSRFTTGETAAVLGAGGIGLLMVQYLASRHAGLIMATGRVPHKLSLAQQFGAGIAVNTTLKDAVKVGRDAVPMGFDIIYDLVGSQETLAQAIALGRHGARIILIAAPPPGYSLSFSYTDTYRKDITIAASRIYPDEDFNHALVLMASGSIHIEPLITRRYSLNQTAEALEFTRNNRAEAIKVLIEPQRLP